MPNNTIRFAVGTLDDSISAVWRMWVQGDDVYLGVRDALNAYKISLHASGIWRVAQVRELERDDPQADRLMFKWQRPEEFIAGWTASIGILISPISPARPFEKTDNSRLRDAGITWIPRPNEGNKIIFRVLFSKSVDFDIEGQLQGQHTVLAKMQKRNGEYVWLMAVECPLSEFETKKILEVIDAVKIHMKREANEDTPMDARAALLVSEDVPGPSTQPTFFEVALGKDNLDIPEE